MTLCAQEKKKRQTGWRRAVNANCWLRFPCETQLRGTSAEKIGRGSAGCCSQIAGRTLALVKYPQQRPQNRYSCCDHSGEGKNLDWLAGRIEFELTVEFPMQFVFNAWSPSTSLQFKFLSHLMLDRTDLSQASANPSTAVHPRHLQAKSNTLTMSVCEEVTSFSYDSLDVLWSRR